MASPDDGGSDVSDRDAAYQAAFVRGNELFDAGDWSGARQHYKRAYAQRRNPLLLFNIGSTYRRDGKLDEAMVYYRRCLAEAPGDAAYRPQVEDAIARLEQEIAAARAREQPAPESASPVQSTPRPAPPEKSEPSGGSGATRLEISGESADGASDTGSPALRRTGLALVVAGAVGLAWGGYEGWLSRSTSDELSGLMDGSDWTPERQADFERGETAERRAPILLAAGAVGVAGGVAMYLLGRGAGSRQDERAVTVIPHLSGQRVGVAVRLGF